MIKTKCIFAMVGIVTLGACLLLSPSVQAQLMSREELGRSLFFDTNLSKNRTQSCATCHDPEHGFADARPNDALGAVSLGDDGESLGDRNAPTASYAMFTPPFGKKKNGIYHGGQFHDGRANSLADQAGGPPLNPIEMGMADKRAVVNLLLENRDYVAAFKANFGDTVFGDVERTYTAMTVSIAAFEQTDFFAPFDSKYDRYLRGIYKMSTQEQLGMTLFFSNQFTNCNRCHQLNTFAESAQETFSNYEYHNIGVPVNVHARTLNGVAKGHIDDGLLANPGVMDVAQRGKYKTSTLRNIAVTGPYMHNGVFQSLETVVRFYNKYNSPAPTAQINPETGKPWAAPEVEGTISLDNLKVGDALDEKRIKALVAFMKTLTDQRYEHLLEDQ